MVVVPLPPGSDSTIGTYISRGGRPKWSSQDSEMTWYCPLPRSLRSEARLPGRLSTTLALGWAAPDLTERQPCSWSCPTSSVSLRIDLMFPDVPLPVFPEQLP